MRYLSMLFMIALLIGCHAAYDCDRHIKMRFPDSKVSCFIDDDKHDFFCIIDGSEIFKCSLIDGDSNFMIRLDGR